MGDDRPMVYREGDRWVYRASALGRSRRCLLTARRGFTPLAAPEFLMKAADAGNRYEPVVKQRLREEHGYEIGQEQRTIEVPIGDRALVRGHLDAGYIRLPDEDGLPRILEVKSMSRRMWAKWGSQGFDGFASYAAQITAYMEGTQRAAKYAIVNRDTDELLVFDVDEPPIPFDELAEKILWVEDAADTDESFPTCNADPAYWCPYDYLCDRKETVFAELEDGEETVLIRLAADYAEAREAEAEIKAVKANARDELVTAMGDRKKATAGPWKISVSESKRRRLDTTRLRSVLSDAGIDLDDFYTESMSETLRVTGDD